MFYILINFVINLIINQFVIDVLHDGLINHISDTNAVWQRGDESREMKRL